MATNPTKKMRSYALGESLTPNMVGAIDEQPAGDSVEATHITQTESGLNAGRSNLRNPSDLTFDSAEDRKTVAMRPSNGHYSPPRSMG